MSSLQVKGKITFTIASYIDKYINVERYLFARTRKKFLSNNFFLQDSSSSS
jgi:hypothetical protein